MKNKWQDDAGRVYIVYPVSEIQADLQLSRRKVIDCLAELEQIGLIERKKRGRGLPSILYVKNFAMVITSPQDLIRVEPIGNTIGQEREELFKSME